MLGIFLVNFVEVFLCFYVKDEYYFIFNSFILMSIVNSSFFEKNIMKKNIFLNFNDFIQNIHIFKKYSFYLIVLMIGCFNLIINKKILLIMIINITYFIYNSKMLSFNKILNFIEDFNEYFMNIFFDSFNLNLNRNPDLSFYK